MNVQRSVCTVCGYKGGQKRDTPGSFIVEIVLWFFFIIPGVIYTLWRLSSKRYVCPSCGNQSTIAWVTPRGTEIVNVSGGWTDQAENSFRDEAMVEWWWKLLPALPVTMFAIGSFAGDFTTWGILWSIVDVAIGIGLALNYPHVLPNSRIAPEPSSTLPR